MNKVLKLINIAVAVIILPLTLFIPMFDVESDEYGSDIVSIVSLISHSYYTGEVLAALFIGIIFPSFIIIAIACLFFLLKGSRIVGVICASATAALGVLSVAMMAGPLLSSIADIDKISDITIYITAIIPSLLYVVCIACELICAFLSNGAPAMNAAAPRGDIYSVANQAAAAIRQNLQPSAGYRATVQNAADAEEDADMTVKLDTDDPEQTVRVQDMTGMPDDEDVTVKLSPPAEMSIAPDSSAADPMMNEALAQQTYSVSPNIQCVKGEYEGAAFPCDDMIIIGSDPSSANLVIAGERISGLHCEICYDMSKDVYTVSDRSVNGVFVYPPGCRLPANITIEIARGTLILLADESNSFLLN